MLRLQGQGLFQGVHPALFRLPGEPVDEIQAEVADLRLTGGGHRCRHLVVGVGTVDTLKLRVAAGLHPHGQAVDSRPTEGAQSLELHAVGVCLHGHFRIFGHVELFIHQLEQLPHPLFAVPAGGSAADVDAGHLVLLGQRGTLLDVGQKGLLVVIHPIFPVCQGIKVAVIALAAAKGDVNVNAKCFTHGLHTPCPLYCGFIILCCGLQCNPCACPIPLTGVFGQTILKSNSPRKQGCP